MALNFSLPPLDEDVEQPAPTRAVALGRWLDTTLTRDAIDAARVLIDALAATNRIALRDARRLALAEKYWAAAEVLWPQLEAKFARASHPLTGEALEAAKNAVGLAHELAVAYKRLLARRAARRVFVGRTRTLVLLLQRSLQVTTRILANSYLSYAPVPPRTWLDAHAIYAFAHERGLNQKSNAADEPGATPERTYVRALLLALANPYGFQQGDLTTVIGYLDRASRSVKITDVPPVHRLAKAVAIVPVGHDFPPFAASKGGAVEGSKMYLLTFDLAFELQAELQALEAGGPQPPGFADAAISREHCIALATRLLRQWAIPPARQFNRVSSRAHVQMCPGLPGAWQNVLNARAGAREVPTGIPPMVHCQVLNHTPAGYALRQTDAAPAALRIGELIAVRGDTHSGMQVAVVRWFRNTMKGSGLDFGCELLSERPEAAMARPETAADDGPTTPVLVLPEDPAVPGHEGSPPQLIAPAGLFGVEHGVAIEGDGKKGLAVLTKLVERGPGFELFDYAVVD